MSETPYEKWLRENAVKPFAPVPERPVRVTIDKDGNRTEVR